MVRLALLGRGVKARALHGDRGVHGAEELGVGEEVVGLTAADAPGPRGRRRVGVARRVGCPDLERHGPGPEVDERLGRLAPEPSVAAVLALEGRIGRVGGEGELAPVSVVLAARPGVDDGVGRVGGPGSRRRPEDQQSDQNGEHMGLHTNSCLPSPPKSNGAFARQQQCRLYVQARARLCPAGSRRHCSILRSVSWVGLP